MPASYFAGSGVAGAATDTLTGSIPGDASLDAAAGAGWVTAGDAGSAAGVASSAAAGSAEAGSAAAASAAGAAAADGAAVVSAAASFGGSSLRGAGGLGSRRDIAIMTVASSASTDIMMMTEIGIATISAR